MMLANFFGSDGVIVLIIAIVVIFGGSQLPKIARNVGTAGKEFRKAQQEAEEDARAQAAARAVAQTPAVPPAPVAPPAVDASPGASETPAASDNVTISRAELEALLDERLGKRPTSPN